MKTVRRLLRLCPLLVALTWLQPEAAFAAIQIIKGPYLQNVTMNSIVVMWESSAGSDARVDFGTTGPNQSSVSDATSKTIHELKLTGLLANTVYYYKVTSGGVSSATNSFITAPATADVPFRFVAYGDTRTYPADHAAVVQAIIRHQPDFVLHVGDHVEYGRTYSSWGPEFFTPAGPLIKNAPFFSVLGNHEYNGSEQMWFYSFLSLPNNENWYAFTYGSARIIALNSCSSLDGNASFAPGSAQYKWLDAELKSAAFQAAKWRIAFFHHPPYSSRITPEMTEVQQYLVPLFEQYGIDVVFNGHDHNYRRVLRNGIHYVVTGAGGAPFRDVGAAVEGQVYAEAAFEHCVIDITPTTLNCYASRNDGSVMDKFSLTNAPPGNSPPVAQAQSVTANEDTAVAITLTATDPDNDALTYRIVASPAHGILSGTLPNPVYTPDPNYSGPDSFSFTASDGQAESQPAAVSITVASVNDPPTVPQNLTATVSGGAVKLAWSGSTDPDRNQIRYALYRSTTSGAYDWSHPIATTGKLAYTDRKAKTGTLYYYVVRAQDNGTPVAWSNPSNEVQVRP